jgi:alcohol dehydrogenase/benzil reductase ((S)-benzoin forming)
MKTAIITGASYGIGKSIADALLQRGWKIYGLSRSKPNFEHTNFVWLQCDLSISEQIKTCLANIAEPTINALISNAGTIAIEMASDVTEKSYVNTFSVNVLAPMLIVHVLKEKIRSATIISISSVSDRLPEADVALYCSSKAANTSYFNSVARELKDTNVFAVLPDYVDTPMLHGTMDDDKSFDWNKTIKPDDIARLCLRLIDSKHDLESGSNIIVVTEALKEDLKSVEKLYGFNTDTNALARL